MEKMRENIFNSSLMQKRMLQLLRNINILLDNRNVNEGHIGTKSSRN